MSVTLELNLSTLEWVNKHTLHFKECRAVAEAECQSSTELGGQSSVFSLSIQQSRRLPGNTVNMPPSCNADQVFKTIKRHHRGTEEMPGPVECLLYSHEAPRQISRIYKYTNRERGWYALPGNLSAGEMETGRPL